MHITTDADIFEHTEGVTTVIAHGVNVRGLMGAGFAKLIADRYPHVRQRYSLACACEMLAPGQAQILKAERGVLVANIASQERPGRDARESWLRSGLESMYLQLEQNPNIYNVKLPLIGAGIGGLDPVRAADIIRGVADAHETMEMRTALHFLPSDKHTRAVCAHLLTGEVVA